MMHNFQNFEVLNVPLSGKNLVEASAGTGKTYSIAILILRMVVEQGVSIDKQLIVTFTNLAVAELQERVRHFLSKAMDAANGRQIDDETIVQICESIQDKQLLKDRLRAALLMIDEASILTIHGFCQRMLGTYAFDTKQSFDATLLSDVSEFVEQVANQFWRRELSVLPESLIDFDLLEQIRKSVKDILKKGLGDIPFVIADNLEDADALQIQNDLVERIQQEQEQEEAIKATFDDNYEALVQEVLTGKVYTKRKGDLKEPNLFYKLIYTDFQKEDLSKYESIIDLPFWKTMFSFFEFKRETKQLKDDLVQILYAKAYNEYLPFLKENLQDSGVLTFDAMILNLYKTVVEENNTSLIEKIRLQYPVVFIDEFQDTDIVQFELFNKLFVEEPNDTTLFLIGDPKQSIYSFRNADVDSYLLAASKVEHKYTMGVNYRSSTAMIAAVNQFFEASGKGAFGYDEQDALFIEYQRVEAKNVQKQILKNGVPITETLLLKITESKEAVYDGICNTIQHLLNPSNGYTIEEGKGFQRRIAPQDIAILTTEKKQGFLLKNQLHDLNIPAVCIDDRKVFDSQEAKDISLILQSFLLPNLRNIKSALRLTFLQNLYALQFDKELPVLELDDTVMLELFRTYANIAQTENVYQALQKLFNDFSVPQYLISGYNTMRTLSNLMQIADIIQEHQYRNELDVAGVWAWLHKSINAKYSADDAYAQQIESDDHAVNVLTIHKSKGLEFPIVFLQGLDLNKPDFNSDLVELKSENRKRYIKFENGINEDEQVKVNKAIDQEKRRLIYVALTRAVFQTYIFVTNTTHPKTRNKFNDSVLYQLVSNVSSSEYINFNYEVPENDVDSLMIENKDSAIKVLAVNQSELAKSKSAWGLYSFSSLSVAHEHIAMPYSDSLENYDQFIFNLLPRGTMAGTILHEIFEKIDFRKNFLETQLLSNYEQNLLNSFKKMDDRYDGVFAPNIAQMIYHVLYANIEFDDILFSLNKIAQEQKLAELEFNFPVNQQSVKDALVPLLQQYYADIDEKYFNLTGMLTGFIDLVFEHEGKFYILDWKSNYLGFDLGDYSGQVLKDAMIQQQYILQYLIYTVALDKYLQQRLGAAYDYDTYFGGVVYVFLRGARAGQTSGIYTDKPDKHFIQQLSKVLTEA